MTPPLSRRRVLSFAAAALGGALAGCSGDADAHELAVTNRRETEQTVALAVENERGDELVSRSLTLPAGTTEVVWFEGEPDATVVRVDGERSRFVWEKPGCPGPTTPSSTLELLADGSLGVDYGCQIPREDE